MTRATMLLVLLALGAATAADPPADESPRTTFSVDYVVTIRRGDPHHAEIRWRLSGIDEITHFRLVFRDARASGVTGTGRLAWQGRTLQWTPGGPYAHLAYRIALDRKRPGSSRYDSYASDTWVATRARHLFPEMNVTFRPGAQRAKSRARLTFKLPAPWRSVAIGERLGPHRFAVMEPGKRLDRPRGWFLLGDVDVHERAIAGATVTVARAPGSGLDPDQLFRLYERTLPLLVPVLGPPPPTILLVSAPDPMWRGGISGEDSFFVNGRIPLRSADATSTYLHELFHVWAPLRPGEDGHWISEGLAEYYSLALQRRADLLSADRFDRGIARFARQGHWGGDLSRNHDAAALYNSGPFVFHWLDREIARATGGKQSLDDAVRRLAHDGAELRTASLLRAVNRVAGRDFTPLFRRYVFRGQQPPLDADLPGPRPLGYPRKTDAIRGSRSHTPATRPSARSFHARVT